MRSCREVANRCRLSPNQGWQTTYVFIGRDRNEASESPSGLRQTGGKRSYDPTISSYDWILWQVSWPPLSLSLYLSFSLFPRHSPTWLFSLPTPSVEFLASVARSTAPRRLEIRLVFLLFLFSSSRTWSEEKKKERERGRDYWFCISS